VLRFHFQWSDYALRQARIWHRALPNDEAAAERWRAAGEGWGKAITPRERASRLGVARMRRGAEEGVTNSFGQPLGLPKCVADGGVFASNPHKNPTLTILALAAGLRPPAGKR